MTVEEITAQMRRELSPKFGVGEARAMIRLIFHHLKGWSATDMIINEGRELSNISIRNINEIVERVLRNEPIQYVLGEAYFYGMNLMVGPGVLIPRPETEELVDLIVKENRESDLQVLDIGTGSGNIAISLFRHLPFAEVTAIDISERALAKARDNAKRLKANVKFKRQDVFTAYFQPESFDIIVSNPPYIGKSEMRDMEPNVLDYEPSEALFVPDTDPLMFYRRIAEIGQQALKESGHLYFEINPLHAEELGVLLRALGYVNIELIKDIHGKLRFAKSTK